MLQYLKEREYFKMFAPIIPYSIFSINVYIFLKMFRNYFTKKSQRYIEN